MNEDVIRWLESPDGEAWSRNHHKTSGNQVDLVSLKEADSYEHKEVVWRGAMTVKVVDPWESY